MLGFAGRICEIYIPCPNNCTSEKNGICSINGKCLCNDGYDGQGCETFKKNDTLNDGEFGCINNCSGRG